jgi:hypothetical protein
MVETWSITSRNNPAIMDYVSYNLDTDTVSCTCPGFFYHGYCNHIRYFKNTISKMKRIQQRRNNDGTSN